MGDLEFGIVIESVSFSVSSTIRGSANSHGFQLFIIRRINGQNINCYLVIFFSVKSMFCWTFLPPLPACFLFSFPQLQLPFSCVCILFSFRSFGISSPSRAMMIPLFFVGTMSACFLRNDCTHQLVKALYISYAAS